MARTSTRLVIQIGLVVIGYYLVPLTGGVAWARAVGALAALGVVVWLVGRKVAHEVHTPTPEVRADNLVLTRSSA